MRLPLALLLGIASINANANVIQSYTGLSYANPAELFQIKNNEFIIGAAPLHIAGKFNGEGLNLNTFSYDRGISRTKRNSLLGYGRIAKRANDKLVFAVDVTEPFHSNLAWDKNAVTRYAGTENLMTNIDVSPRFSLSLNPKLYLGAGLNFNFMENNEVNWTLPISKTGYANLKNPTSSFALGFNAGFYYLINQTNFLGLAYYSSTNQKTRGSSYLADRVNTHLAIDLKLPSTTVLNYVHLFNQSWLLNLRAFYTEWSTMQYAFVNNTAAPPPVGPNFIFPMRYRNSPAIAAAVRNQFKEKLGLTLIGMVDKGPEHNNLRTILFPSDVQYFAAIAADYKATKNATIELLYGHGYSSTRLANNISLNNQTFPFTTGKIHINANLIDLRFKLQM